MLLRKGFNLPSARMNRLPVFGGLATSGVCATGSGSEEDSDAAGAGSNSDDAATSALGTRAGPLEGGFGGGTADGGSVTPPLSLMAKVCLLARRMDEVAADRGAGLVSSTGTSGVGTATGLGNAGFAASCGAVTGAGSDTTASRVTRA